MNNIITNCLHFSNLINLLLILIFPFIMESHTDALLFPQDNRAASNLEERNISLEGSCTVVCDASSMTFTAKNNIYKWEYKQTPKVAFSAVRNDNHIYTEVRQNLVVTFDYVLVNYGRGYNSRSSAFTVPTNGIYMFEFTIFKDLSRSPLTVALTVNRDRVFSAFADERSSGRQTAHNSGLIALEIADVVRIEIVNGQLEAGWQKSTFSGFLVYETDF